MIIVPAPPDMTTVILTAQLCAPICVRRAAQEQAAARKNKHSAAGGGSAVVVDALGFPLRSDWR